MPKHLSVVAVTIMALLAPLAAGAGGQKTWARFNKTYNESLMVRENGEIIVAGQDIIRYSPAGAVIGRAAVPGDDRGISWKEFLVYPNGDFLAIYSIQKAGTDDIRNILRIMRLDSGGKPLWERIIEAQLHYVAIFPDDCAVLAVAMSGSCELIKLDGSGNTVRQITYPGYTPLRMKIIEETVVFVTATGLVKFNSDLELIEEKEGWKGFRPSDLAAIPNGYVVAGCISREAKELLPWEAGLGIRRDPRRDSGPIVAILSDRGDVIKARAIPCPPGITLDHWTLVADQDGLLQLGTWSYWFPFERNYTLFTSRLDWSLKTRTVNYYFPVLSPGHQLRSARATPDGGVALVLGDFRSNTTVKIDSQGRCLDPSCAVFQVSSPAAYWGWLQNNVLAPIFYP